MPPMLLGNLAQLVIAHRAQDPQLGWMRNENFRLHRQCRGNLRRQRRQLFSVRHAKGVFRGTTAPYPTTSPAREAAALICDSPSRARQIAPCDWAMVRGWLAFPLSILDNLDL